ncbi:MAG: FHA domain-containing protein [Anaerolineales bacterium]|jgi:pSer/pThr/pTyr-binding forkhead associated (FHA) protein
MPENIPPKFQAVPENIFLVVGSNMISIEHQYTNIGRHVNNNVIITDPNVSRYHARIVLNDGKFYLEDLGSTYGTKLNGKEIKVKQLFNGDTISIAGTPILFIDRSSKVLKRSEATTGTLSE